MSIIDVITDCVRKQQLYLVTPRVLGSSSKRVLLVHERLWRFLQEEGPTDEWEDRKGFLQADFDQFASGEPIGPKYLFLLYHAREAVWEIRSVRPDPSIRVLGRFADKDIFVATNWATREELGGWQSRAWRDVKVMARTVWAQTMLTYQPIKSINVHDVVSGAIDGKYFRQGD